MARASGASPQAPGVQLPEVNRLLKQFDQMQKTMKKLAKGGMLKNMMRGMAGRLPPGFGPWGPSLVPRLSLQLAATLCKVTQDGDDSIDPTRRQEDPVLSRGGDRQSQTPRTHQSESVGLFKSRGARAEIKLRLDVARIEHWVAQGAHMSDRVKFLLTSFRKQAA